MQNSEVVVILCKSGPLYCSAMMFLVAVKCLLWH